MGNVSIMINSIAYIMQLMTEMMEIKTRAIQAIDRNVKQIGNSGGIYLPKDWVGKKVKVLLIEDTQDKTS